MYSKSYFDFQLKKSRKERDKNKHLSGIARQRSKIYAGAVHAGWTVKDTDFSTIMSEKFPEEFVAEIPPNPSFYSAVHYKQSISGIGWFQKNKEKFAIASARGYYLKKWGNKNNEVMVLLAAINGVYQYIVIKNTLKLPPYGVKAQTKNGVYGPLILFKNNVTFKMRAYVLSSGYYIQGGKTIYLPQTFET